MPVIVRFGEPVEHLETHEVQVAQVVVVALSAARDRMLCSIEDEPVGECPIVHMLDFEYDTVLVPVMHHDVRRDFLAERARHSRVFKGDVVDAVASVEIEDGVEEVYRNPFVFWIAEEHLEGGIVVDVYVLVFFAVFRNAGRNVSAILVCLVDFGKHGCILFFCHRDAKMSQNSAENFVYIRFRVLWMLLMPCPCPKCRNFLFFVRKILNIGSRS